MLIADALFHYAPLTTPAIPLDISVNHLHIMPQKKIDFQDALHSDPTLCTLSEMILSGWPENICDIPMDLWPYHHAHDVLTVEDGIILHSKALVMPPSERDKVLQSIYEGHQGISKCQYCACQCVYWPCINWDIPMCCWSMCYMPVPSPTGTATATQANPSPRMPMATSWSWLHALWWQRVPHHHQLLLKDALRP